MRKTIIVRYGELALKSEPVRRRFERCLIENIRLVLKGINYVLAKERGRIFIETKRTGASVKRLARLPGIVSVSPAVRTNANMEAIRSAAVNAAKKILISGKTFAVRTRRVGEHTFSSQDVNVAIGSAILKAVPGTRVNLSAPDVGVSIEVRGKNAYVFTEIIEGVGGLPINTQGNVVALFSGGIDSSVAAFLMMKRGCRVFLLFLDSRPYGDKGARKRATAVAKKLAEFDPKLELRVAPIGQILRTIVEKAPRRLTRVLHKRAMLRMAEEVARRVEAESMVTGESSDQIASQTLANLRVIDEACQMPVMRPLIGMDKVEVERIAHRIGTFKMSRGLSASFSPRRSDTRANLEDVRKAEEDLDLPALINSAIAELKVVRLR